MDGTSDPLWRVLSGGEGVRRRRSGRGGTTASGSWRRAPRRPSRSLWNDGRLAAVALAAGQRKRRLVRPPQRAGLSTEGRRAGDVRWRGEERRKPAVAAGRGGRRDLGLGAAAAVGAQCCMDSDHDCNDSDGSSDAQGPLVPCVLFSAA